MDYYESPKQSVENVIQNHMGYYKIENHNRKTNISSVNGGIYYVIWHLKLLGGHKLKSTLYHHTIIIDINVNVNVNVTINVNIIINVNVIIFTCRNMVNITAYAAMSGGD